jgi:hypothetical protein
MSANDGRWSVRFPDLFSDQYADYADARLSFTTAAVPEYLVSRLHLVAVTPAADYIAEHDPVLADVLRLAGAMGLIRPAA